MELDRFKKTLLDIVKVTISDKLNNTETLNKQEYLHKFPELQEKGATFVTLTLNDNLRGCIGSLISHTTLFNDLTSNALSAAFKDPRFSPLTKEEFENINIEVSLIGAITPVSYSNFEDLKTKIKPFVHGVILKSGNNQGTFLPQVWEELPEFDPFMVHLFHKAGLDPQRIERLPEIFIYTVEKIQE